MGFLGKTGNILYLILGIIFVLAGLGTLAYGATSGDSGSLFYGVVLLLIGGARIFWSVARMRALSAYQARQLQARQMRQMGTYGYPPQPGYGQPGYPPQPGYGQPGYPPQQGYPPQAGYGQPGYPPQQGYPPQPGQYGQPGYPPPPPAYPPQPGQYGQPAQSGYPGAQFPAQPTQTPDYTPPSDQYPG